MSRFQMRLVLILGVCLFSIAARFIPHVPNVSPFLAVAVFAGAIMPSFWMGLGLSLGALILSDLSLAMFGHVSQHGGGFIYPGMGFVYLAYVVAALIGRGFRVAGDEEGETSESQNNVNASQNKVIENQNGWLQKSKTIFMAGAFASVTFFILSNLGVWLFMGLYKTDAQGLVDCFVLALPFFGNTLLSTMGGLLVLYSLEAVGTKSLSGAVLGRRV